MPEDVQYEVEHRGKTHAELEGFAYNDFARWRRNFAAFEFVTPIKADASQFNFATIAPIKFMFLDCDLYKPTLNVLHNMIPHLADDFCILVDDVKNNDRWDGAYQAFIEFSESTSYECRVIGGDCGVITPVRSAV